MYNLFLVAHDDGQFITVGESLLDSLVAILGVFLVLLIIIGSVKLLSLIKQKNVEEKEEPQNEVVENKFYKVNENDENQMAAVLVASIDFYEETKQAPVVLGIREVK